MRTFHHEAIPVTAIRHKRIPGDLNTSLSDHDMRRVAKEVIRHADPDIIHVGHAMRVHEFVDAAIQLGVPYVVTLTDFFFLCPKFVLLTTAGHLCAGPEAGTACAQYCPELPSSFVASRLSAAKRLLDHAAAVFSPSQFVRQVFAKEFHGLGIEVLGHGLNQGNLRLNQRRYGTGDKITFCYAGSLNHHKGVHLLLEAFKRLESTSAELLLYGSGTDRIYRRQIEAQAAADQRVRFMGTFAEVEVGDILRRVDVLVLPSLWYENHPLILVEALACNVPVVTADAGGMAERIENGYNGYTFRLGDGADLQRVMESIVDNPSVLNELKRNIKQSLVPTVEQEGYVYERAYRRYARH